MNARSASSLLLAVRSRALKALVIAALVAFGVSWGPEEARAESLIKRPGAHNHYSFELEPHLNFYAYNNNAYAGPGVRVSIPFMHNGPISSINNNMAISFGMDMWFPPSGYGVSIPVAAQWNFYFTDIISVLGEVGVVTNVGSYGFSVNVLNPYIQGGGRFQFGNVGLLVRLGWPTFSVGANFQF